MQLKLYAICYMLLLCLAAAMTWLLPAAAPLIMLLCWGLLCLALASFSMKQRTSLLSRCRRE